jgi:hypothetical protein
LLLIALIVIFVRGWHIPTSVTRPISALVSRVSDFFARDDSMAIRSQRTGIDASQRPVGWFRKLLPLLTLLVAPHGIILLSGLPQWMSRPAILAVLACLGGCYACWWALNPNARILGSDALLNQPQCDEKRPRTILLLRGVLLAVGVSAVVMFGLPFASISLRLAKGEKPVTVTGTVVRNEWGFRASYYLGQFLTVSSQPWGKAEYQLFYCVTIPRIGQDYDLTVMPGSSLVLDVHDHSESQRSQLFPSSR